MTHQDFELITAVIAKQNIAHSRKCLMALDFADALAVKNHRFDKDRFFKACTGQPNKAELENIDLSDPTIGSGEDKRM